MYLFIVERAQNFAIKPDLSSVRILTTLGFLKWLERVKTAQSAAVTLQQLAGFIAWWKSFHPKRVYTAVQVLTKVATTEKYVVEKFNTYLHVKGFRPASILNRIGAVEYGLQFVR